MFTGSFWTSSEFVHETETLTRALQVALSTDTDCTTDVLVTAAVNPIFSIKPESAVSFASALDAETTATKRTQKPGLSPTAKKVSKKKSRARERSADTTFIAVDPTNFRRMVQEVTGNGFSGAYTAGEAAVMKPGGQRGGGWEAAEASRRPPTLDTSAFLLERTGSQPPFGSALGESGMGIDPPTFPCFPTLDSWGSI